MKKVVLFLVGIVVFILLIRYRLDFGSFSTVVRQRLSWVFFAAIGAAILMQLVIRSARFMLLSRDVIGVRYGAGRSLLITSASFFMALATPNKMGDMMRGVFMKGQGAEVTAVSMLEYALDVSVTLLIPLLGMPVILSNYRNEALVGYSIIALIVAVLYILLKKTSLIRILAGVRVFERNREGISVVGSHLKAASGRKATLLKGFAFTILFNCVYYIIFYVVLDRLGAGMTFYETVVAASLGMLLGAFSMVPMGMGTRDASAYGVLVALGCDPALSMAGVVVMRGLTVPLVIASGTCYAVAVKMLRA